MYSTTSRKALLFTVCVPLRFVIGTLRFLSQYNHVLRLIAGLVSANWILGRFSSPRGFFGGPVRWAEDRLMHGILWGRFSITGLGELLMTGAIFGLLNALTQYGCERNGSSKKAIIGMSRVFRYWLASTGPEDRPTFRPHGHLHSGELQRLFTAEIHDAFMTSPVTTPMGSGIHQPYPALHRPHSLSRVIRSIGRWAHRDVRNLYSYRAR